MRHRLLLAIAGAGAALAVVTQPAVAEEAQELRGSYAWLEECEAAGWTGVAEHRWPTFRCVDNGTSWLIWDLYA